MLSLTPIALLAYYLSTTEACRLAAQARAVPPGAASPLRWRLLRMTSTAAVLYDTCVRDAGVHVRLLAVSLPGEGQLNPLLPLLRAAQGAGHAVAVATARSYIEDVQSGGVSGLAAGPDFRFDRWSEIWPELGRRAAGRAGTVVAPSDLA